MTLGMCYRYIFLFVEIVENTYLAIKSRVGGVRHYKIGQHVVAWKMASLWQRSVHLNREVYDAMLSRGFNGEPKVLDEFRVSQIDYFWILSVIFVLTGLLWIK